MFVQQQRNCIIRNNNNIIINNNKQEIIDKCNGKCNVFPLLRRQIIISAFILITNVYRKNMYIHINNIE